MVMKLSAKALPFVALLTLAFIATGSWLIQMRISAETRTEVENSLSTITSTSHQAVKVWLKEHRATARLWADTTLIRNAASQLLITSRDKEQLLQAPAQKQLREWFAPLKAASGYQGYFIIDRRNTNLASSRDQNIAHQNPLATQSAYLKKVWSGDTAASIPTKSDVPLPDGNGVLQPGLPTMFVGAPIVDSSGNVIAIFTLRLDPSKEFTTLLQQGRIGKTGETYAFDREGLLISDSRFDENLRITGLIPEHSKSILNIELRDPGVNLAEGQASPLPRDKQPLTYMAKQATAGLSGTNLVGYRDYRGVRVVSAWVWDDDLGFGIATEQDIDEAYRVLHLTRYSILILSVLVAFILLSAALVFRLQHKQRLAEERLSDLLKYGIGPIVVVDDKGVIQYLNEQADLLFGYPKQALLGRHIETVIPERFHNVHSSYCSGFLQHPKVRSMGTKQMTLYAKHRDGSEIQVEIGLIPYRSTEGLQVTCAIRDIRERIKAEEELTQYRKYLEELVSERTADLQTRSSELESYSYTLAHDLSTPIRSIISFSQILKQDSAEKLDDEAKDHLDRIIAAGKRMAQLIDDSLYLFHITRSILRYQNVDLSAMANRLVAEKMQPAPERVVQWKIENNLVAYTDASALETVLLHLLTNALKYTNNSSPAEIEFGRRIINGDAVYFVKDNGTGFDDQYKDKLFKPFHRLHSDPEIEGSGIGLAVVQSIIQRLHGRVWAESGVNKGATFYFTLNESPSNPLQA
jgi:PAS domain S-box-containing protein